MREIYAISDTHFNHANILTVAPDGRKVRDFASVEEMNETMIDRWNATVHDRDIVYHLGDVYFDKASSQDIETILSRLKGRKRLVLGNHDNAKSPVLQRFFQKILGWRAFPEFGLLLTHVPVHPSTLGEVRFRKASSIQNIHGHVHGNSLDDPRYVNVSVEAIDYTPVPLRVP